MNAEAENTSYFPVSPRKFIVLSLLTWGVYQLYWFYKNWSFVRSRDRSGILPLARAVFAPLWYPAFLGDLNKNLESRPEVSEDRLMPAAIYFLFALSFRFPDPFWLVGLFSFVPLLPAVYRINAANRHESGDCAKNSSWKTRHLVLALLSGPLLTMVVASAIGLIPSTQVTPGWLLWGPSQNFLERSAIVEPGEQVFYYYSQGIFSFAEDGNLLTEQRVITYWTDPKSGQLYVEDAFFSEIEDTVVEYGDWVDPTVLTVILSDGSQFALTLSTEGRRDRQFLDKLEQLIRR